MSNNNLPNHQKYYSNVNSPPHESRFSGSDNVRSCDQPKIDNYFKNKISWRSLIYFIIGTSIIHKMFGIVHFLLPFPINYLAILALLAKIAESWLDQQGFEVLAKYLKSFIDIAEVQIDNMVKKYWHPINSVDAIRNKFKRSPSNNSENLLQYKDLQLAQCEALRKLAIAYFEERRWDSKFISNGLERVGLGGFNSKLVFQQTYAIDFQAQNLLGISFKVKNSSESTPEPLKYYLKVRARIQNNTAVENENYFKLISVIMVNQDTWEEIEIVS